MSVPREPMGVIAYKLARAMSFGTRVAVDVMWRPRRPAAGLVTGRRIREGREPPRRGEDRSTRSNLIATIGGEDIEVERIARVKEAT